jgi:hypothetical protein
VRLPEPCIVPVYRDCIVPIGTASADGMASVAEAATDPSLLLNSSVVSAAPAPPAGGVANSKSRSRSGAATSPAATATRSIAGTVVEVLSASDSTAGAGASRRALRGRVDSAAASAVGEAAGVEGVETKKPETFGVPGRNGGGSSARRGGGAAAATQATSSSSPAMPSTAEADCTGGGESAMEVVEAPAVDFSSGITVAGSVEMASVDIKDEDVRHWEARCKAGFLLFRTLDVNKGLS